MSENVDALNQIIKIIDEKATEYKANYIDLKIAQREAGRKIILDLLDDAKNLANKINPKPLEVIQDLLVLEKQIQR